VTVVATGIGAEAKPDISLVSNRTSRVSADANEFRLQANSTENFTSTNSGNAAGTATSNSNSARAVAPEEKAEASSDLEYLDIPAFLRKQAD
jgi:cell division protein FtsZ